MFSSPVSGVAFFHKILDCLFHIWISSALMSFLSLLDLSLPAEQSNLLTPSNAFPTLEQAWHKRCDVPVGPNCTTINMLPNHPIYSNKNAGTLSTAGRAGTERASGLLGCNRKRLRMHK